jgi:hypothetical protein
MPHRKSIQVLLDLDEARQSSNIHRRHKVPDSGSSSRGQILPRADKSLLENQENDNGTDMWQSQMFSMPIFAPTGNLGSFNFEDFKYF